MSSSRLASKYYQIHAQIVPRFKSNENIRQLYKGFIIFAIIDMLQYNNTVDIQDVDSHKNAGYSDDLAFFDGFKPRELIMNIKKTSERVKFVNKIILDYLEIRKGTGATIVEIREDTGLDRATISKSITYLVATRQAYRINESAGVYHKNGTIIHFRNMEKKTFGRKMYTFFHLDRLRGEEYVYIQEKEIGKLNTITVRGGIMIEKRSIEQFILELSDFKEEIKRERS